jgi:soluble cytochrome b562
MNKRLLSTVIASLLTFGGLNLSVLNAASHGGGHGDHTELGEQMETISKAFRTLRRQAGDASKNAASAELAGKMHKAAVEAAKHDPAWTSDQPKGEQAKFVAGYKKEMEHFIAALASLEKAFKAGDNAAAEELIAKLRDAQKEGHKAYKEPDEE